MRNAMMASIFLLIVLVRTLSGQSFSDSNADRDALPSDQAFYFEDKGDRLLIHLHGKPAFEYVYRDPNILRPYFANVHTPNGLKVTRNHPPVAGEDAVDHDTMHPGVWLAFGDISRNDYWRNKAKIEHLRFVETPKADGARFTFATESQLLAGNGEHLCQLNNRFTLIERPSGWMLVWDATFLADKVDFTFGDQEEMGFGARVATAFAEKNGGRLINSAGQSTAAETWGQPAAWCDYSGRVGDRHGGIMLMAAPTNFRESWWHNRNYGVFVANPFGRAAMKQGEASAVAVKRGESIQLVFGAMFHDGDKVDAEAEYAAFLKQ